MVLPSKPTEGDRAGESAFMSTCGLKIPLARFIDRFESSLSVKSGPSQTQTCFSVESCTSCCCREPSS